MIMRRFFNVLLCASLVGAGAVYLTSCAAQKGPLSPNTSLIGSTSAGTGLPKVSGITPTLGGAAISVSQTVQVQFNMAMDPASFNTGTVQMFKQAADGANEYTYSNFTLSYDAALKVLRIIPSPAFWDDNNYYRILLTTGITSTTGQPLDGNQNGIAEAGAFDNFMSSFRTTGLPTAPGYSNILSLVSGGGPQAPLSLSSVVVNYYTVATDGTTAQASATLTGNKGAIAAALPVTITATFDQRLDVATAWVSTSALASAFVFTDANGTPVAPTSVTLTAGNTAIQAEFMNGLAASTKFKMGIKGGLTGLRSANENNLNLMRYGYFDGSGANKIPNGIAEASDDTLALILETTAGSFNGTVVTPPMVTIGSTTYDSGLRRWSVVFNTPSGNNKMDASTLNAGNIMLMGNNAVGSGADFSLTQVTQVITPKDLVYDVVANTLYVYIPDKFYSNNGAAYGYLNFKILISHSVRSADGLYLDGQQGHTPDHVATQDANDDCFTGNGSAASSVRIYTLF